MDDLKNKVEELVKKVAAISARQARLRYAAFFVTGFSGGSILTAYRFYEGEVEEEIKEALKGSIEMQASAATGWALNKALMVLKEGMRKKEAEKKLAVREKAIEKKIARLEEEKKAFLDAKGRGVFASPSPENPF